VDSWTIDLPRPWRTAAIASADLIATAPLTDGAAMLTHLTLEDGTNLFVVAWPSGSRLARLGPATGWAVQEHYCGELPPGEAGRVVADCWRIAVGALVQAKSETIAESPVEAEAAGMVRRPAA
jgi:hypothetical protein